MCVIALIEKTRPTPEMVEKMWEANDDGGGVAYREGEGKDKVVRWQKGITDPEEMKDLIAKLPMPFVAHFRIASSGGVKRALTHPFPVDKLASCALTGTMKGAVLFHNGNWNGWEHEAKEAAIKSNTPIPLGKWSDTRAMAWLCSIYGPGFMEFVTGQKGVLYWPNHYEVFTGTSGWDKVKIDGDENRFIWCSNNHFMSRVKTTHYVCKFGQCQRRDQLDKDGHCPTHKGGVAPFIRERESKAGTTEAGGTQGHTQSPFPKVTPGVLISVEIAKQLKEIRDKKGNRLCSKGLLKKIKDLHGNLLAPGRRGEKARKKLGEISQRLMPKIPTTGSEGSKEKVH